MPQEPDIVFVVPDQLRAGFLGCYDAGFSDTPHIDSVADRGAQ